MGLAVGGFDFGFWVYCWCLAVLLRFVSGLGFDLFGWSGGALSFAVAMLPFMLCFRLRLRVDFILFEREVFDIITLIVY